MDETNRHSERHGWLRYGALIVATILGVIVVVTSIDDIRDTPPNTIPAGAILLIVIAVGALAAGWYFTTGLSRHHRNND